MNEEPLSSLPESERPASFPFDVLESISDALFTLDAQWRFTYVNTRAEQLLHRSRQELTGKNIWEDYPHTVNTIFYQKYHQAVETRETVSFEAFSDTLDAWLFVRASPLPGGLCILMQDITEQKVAEAERLERAAIVESSFDAVIGKNLDGIITSWNPSAVALYGYTEEEALGRHISLIVPPERAHELPPLMERLRHGERIESFETVRRHKDGTLLSVSLTISPIRNRQGEIIGASKIAHDITERKRIEEALYMREARLNSILLSAMDAIISVDADQRILLFNVAAEQMFRCSAQEALGVPLGRFIPPRFRSRHTQHVRNFGKTGTTARAMGALMPLVGLRADGEEFPMEATISQIEVKGEKLYTVIIRDISERKLLEEQFLQAQKMEGLGRLAGGIAHDFNNLLAAIIGYAELAELEASDAEKIREYLANVTRAAERAAALTKQLLVFARKQISEMKIIDLNELVLDLETLLRRLIGEHISLRVLPGAKPIVTRVDPSQLAQVLINLVINARDAMPRGGDLTLEVLDQSVEHDETATHQPVSAGHYALLRVRDTGTGMTEEVMAHIFEPFFTTKEPGRGTGLGLATSYSIIKQSNGEIFVESAPGRGTVFSIYLPHIEAAAEPLPTLRTLSRMPVGTKTILFVEDEPLVRGFSVQLLRSLNYTIHEAADGQEALEIAAKLGRETRIDMLITDVIMPRLGGYDLAQRLLAERPELKVLYCSGYTDEEIVRDGVLEEKVAFLHKPYTSSSLAQKVHQVLSSAENA